MCNPVGFVFNNRPQIGGLVYVIVFYYLSSFILTETTEIDVLMLHRTGIYVLESKNYSGWIFGNEKDASWTQTLPNKDKNHFYNPVRQNKTHIMWLNEMLGNDMSTSIIVFSEDAL